MKKRYLSINVWLTFTLLVSMTLLNGCESLSRKKQDTSRLYQPQWLELKAGLPVQTKRGVYVPQIDETWAALWKVQELEGENIALSKTVLKLQAERDLK